MRAAVAKEKEKEKKQQAMGELFLTDPEQEVQEPAECRADWQPSSSRWNYNWPHRFLSGLTLESSKAEIGLKVWTMECVCVCWGGEMGEGTRIEGQLAAWQATGSLASFASSPGNAR